MSINPRILMSTLSLALFLMGTSAFAFVPFDEDSDEEVYLRTYSPIRVGPTEAGPADPGEDAPKALVTLNDLPDELLFQVALRGGIFVISGLAQTSTKFHKFLQDPILINAVLTPYKTRYTDLPETATELGQNPLQWVRDICHREFLAWSKGNAIDISDFSPAKLRIITMFRKDFFKKDIYGNFPPPEKRAQIIAAFKPLTIEHIAAVGPAITRTVEGFFSEAMIYRLDIIRIIRALMPLFPDHIEALGPGITKNADYFFPYVQHPQARSITIAALAPLPLDHIEAVGPVITANADHFFTGGMLYEDRAKIIAALAPCTLDHIEAVGPVITANADHFSMGGTHRRARVIAALAPLPLDHIKAVGPVITANADHFFTGGMSADETSAIIAALAPCTPEKIEKIALNAQYFFTKEMKPYVRARIITALAPLPLDHITAVGPVITANADHFFTGGMSSYHKAAIIANLVLLPPEQIEAVALNAQYFFTEEMKSNDRIKVISYLTSLTPRQIGQLIEQSNETGIHIGKQILRARSSSN